MPAFCRNRHFVLSGYILCPSEMLYPLQLFHLQRSRMQIIALLRVVRDQQHGAAGGAAGKRVHALAGSGFIQPFEGLVQHQQRRIVQQADPAHLTMPARRQDRSQPPAPGAGWRAQ